MQLPCQPAVETRLVSALLNALFPCDLGDGIEVVHDVEVIEIELECDLDDHGAWESAPYEKIEILFDALDAPVTDAADTLPFELVFDTFAVETVPYPRLG